MAEQNTLAKIVFVACHVAFLLHVIAISTPYWVSTDTVQVEGNAVSINKGLWKICVHVGHDSKCVHVDEDKQGPQYAAVKSLYIAAMVKLALVLALFWAQFTLVGWDYPIAVNISVALQWLSVLLCLVAFIMQGQDYNHYNDDIPSDFSIRLAWSYVLAVIGGVITFYTGCMGVRQLLLERGWCQSMHGYLQLP